MLIERLDHLALTTPDAAGVAATYADLLGQPVVQVDVGYRLQCDNIGLVITEAAGAGASGALRVVFAAADIDDARHRLARRGVGGNITGTRLDLDPAATHGVALSVIGGAAPEAGRAGADIAGLDHVVVRTPNAERAVALYGGRLGLDLRLDRARPDIGVRQLFFVVGGLVVEVVQSLKESAGDGPDSIWGLAWRSRDIEASQARMQSAGIAVSNIRDGRKAGSRVFTPKSHTGDVPTLIIGGEGLERT